MEETDVLGPPYTVETFVLRPDDEGAVEANLVRLRATEPTGGAVLYVHGFCDYFFQTEFAQWWADRGWDFYALDLRKYGRSLRDHQTPGYIEDVSAYFEELDLAWEAITARDGHDRVMLSAHSTGGLIGSLWADDREGHQRRQARRRAREGRRGDLGGVRPWWLPLPRTRRGCRRRRP